ncbi:hypothetical protein LDG_8091 [Legionella drancourtii LLAP12]|uniref:Uncharacterized protein n=1 Tax=Legionella drancourtii LLAP12 TaxID=658187 RepID=G9ES19_9GAMM|nr:hypothetical protein LDG_8091 [Legionella drancourtii LLAP12]
MSYSIRSKDYWRFLRKNYTSCVAILDDKFYLLHNFSVNRNDIIILL